MHRHHPIPVILPLPSLHVDALPLLDEEFDGAMRDEAFEACEPVAHHTHTHHATPEISWDEIEDLAAA